MSTPDTTTPPDRPLTLSARSILSTGASLVLTNFATAAAGIVTARALGPDGKGVVTGVLAWPQIIAFFLLMGLATSTSLRVSEAEDGSPPDALGNALGFCVTVGVVGTLVGLLVLPAALDHLGPGASNAARLAMFTLPLSMLAEVLAGINLALGQTTRYNLCRISGGVTVLVLSVALWASGHATPETVIGTYIVAGGLNCVIAGTGVRWKPIAVRLDRLRRDLAYGVRVFLTSLLGLINLRLDILLMTAFLAAREIGWYSIANNVMMPITAVTTATAALMMPAIGRRRATDDPHARREALALVRSTATRYTLLGIAVAGVTAVVAPWGVPTLFGQQFEPAVKLVWILLPGFVAWGYAQMVTAGLVGLRKPWVGNVAQGAGVAITVIMLPILLPKYGATGAAITSTVAYTVSAVITLWALGRVARNATATEETNMRFNAAAGDAA